MSLQVWLPLNGDLRNQGLSPESGLTSHSVSYPAGKMGYCLYTNGVKSASGTFENLKYLTSWSFSLWAKISTDTPSAWADIFVLGSNNDGNTGNIRLEHTGTAGQAQLICNKSETSGSSTNTYMGIGGLGANASNKWAHIVVTNDGTTIRSYLNGNVLTSTAVSNTYSVGGLTGYVQLGATGAKGYLNDIRIYDHVLSTKEIKELSKGLMLHYTFNRGDYGAITNILSYPTPGSSVTPGWDTSLHTRAISVSGWTNGYNPGVTNSSGTKDPQVGYHAHWELINNIPTMVFPRLNYSVSGVTVSRWLGISTSTTLSALTSNTTYTVSFEAMADTEGRIIHGGYYYNNGSSTNFHDGHFYAKNIPVGKWKRYAFTFTTKTVSSTGTFYFYGMQGSNGIAYLRNPQVEIGVTAHDYVPSNKAKDALIYDSSGMNYNGTITGALSSVLEGNSRTVNGSTTRNYERNFYSTYFNGSTYVAYDTQMAIPDAYTISFWIYKLSGGHVIDWRDANDNGSQPIYFNPDTNKIQYHTSAGGSAYFDYVFNNSKWYHIAIAVTSTTGTLYVNGVKQQTVNIVNTPGTIARFHVGCRQNYINIMHMFMRDLRLYATTLSDEDIKQLYATPFIIDDKQNIYGRELREGSGE